MSYVTIRVKPISAGAIKRAGIHNNRLYTELGYDTPENIIIGQSVLNKNYVLIDGIETKKSLKDTIYYRIGEAGAQERKNSVMALEYVMSGTPDFLMAYTPSKYFANCVRFLEKKHGAENIVAIAEHYDESKPHVHIIVVPIIRKEVRWKRSKGDGYIEGKKEENRLCARDFTGNRDMLRKLQDDYFEYCVPFGKECGVTLERGEKVESKAKKYVKKTNHEMGLLNEKFEKYNQLAQEANHQYKIGKLIFEEHQKKLKEIKEQHEKLQAQKDKMERDLNIKIEQQRNEERKNQLMKEGEKRQEKNRLDREAKEKEIKRQEREAKEKAQKKEQGRDMGGGMGM
jgi:hypothetical protein